MSRSGARGRSPALFLIASASVVAAVLAVRLLAPGTLWYFDTTKVFVPNAMIWHDALAAGSLPLWVDAMGLGFPVYAEGQIGAFYPLNALLHLLGPFPAMELSRIVHLSMAGVGSGVLVLRLTGSRAGATVAAVGTVLGGGIVSKLEWTNLVVAYAFIPWIFLALVRIRGRAVSRIALAGLLWGLQGLAGHPNTWAMTGIAAGIVLAVSAPRPWTLAGIALFGAVGIGVAAPQLIPTLQLWSLSVRTAGLQDWDLFSNSATVLDVLLPGFANAFMPLGPQESDFGRQWYPGGLWGLHEAGVYLGLPMLALAGAGCTARRARPFVVVALVMVGIAVLGALRPTIWLETPILNGLRHPARAYMVAGLAASLVAGIGVARISHGRVNWAAAAAPVMISVVAYAAVAGAAAMWPGLANAVIGWAFGLRAVAADAARESAIATMLRPYPLMVELALGGASLAVLLASVRRRAAPRTAMAAGAFAAIALGLFSPSINPVRPEAQLQHTDSPLMRAVSEHGPRRFLALVDPSWYDGIPNQLAATGIRELGMFSSLDLEATSKLTSDIRHPEVDERVAAAVGVDLLAAFGEEGECPGTFVARVDPDVRLCAVEDVTFPPYWLPSDAVGPPKLPERSATVAAIHGVLGIHVADRDVDVRRAVTDSRSATTVRRDNATGVFVVTAPSDGWLWIDRAWWPGWETTVDGQPVSVDRALAGQLVAVPAGVSTVTQHFVPRDAWFGAGVGAATTVFAVAIALGIRARPAREPRRGRATS